MGTAKDQEHKQLSAAFTICLSSSLQIAAYSFCVIQTEKAVVASQLEEFDPLPEKLKGAGLKR